MTAVPTPAAAARSDRGEGALGMVTQDTQDAGAGFRHPPGRAGTEAEDMARRRSLGQTGGARGQPHHRRQRRQRVIRRPSEEFAHPRAQGRRVEHASHRPQPCLGHVARAAAPDDSHDPSRPQRHLDEGTGGAAALGRAVVEQTVERAERQHRDPFAGGEAGFLGRGERRPERRRRCGGLGGRRGRDGLRRRLLPRGGYPARRDRPPSGAGRATARGRASCGAGWPCRWRSLLAADGSCYVPSTAAARAPAPLASAPRPPGSALPDEYGPLPRARTLG
ncbi:hypothetical protein ruthe_01603 [Rubellimicrobium thermophilum DSM 16684]|uniref:Uncharacterized protein n=1 Tax=Rubellimicrobium thermophilum DSM 16684 TaxID=1123069 RepID=S9R1V7_9RHOB|nr:hypothetical protein ruthe_01603 [Rubellimicrobium thermophilum DSM 16684]